MIHPTALVDPAAILETGVSVGPYAVIEADAVIGKDSRVEAHAVIRRYSVLSEEVVVDSFAVVGGLPQDLSFDASVRSSVRVGPRSVIREGVTLHRSTSEGGVTQVGADCLLMANSHVAHDCLLGDGVVLANNVMLAGHVHVGNASFLGGGSGIHQFVSIGELVMIAGNASVTYDVPSFLMVAERSVVTGLNLVGMKRKLSRDAISDLRALYKGVYLRTGNPAKLAEEVTAKTAEGERFLACFTESRRGRFSRSRTRSA
jgi:UDP-N-acetylglucosamine acyltransferase